MLPPSFKPRVLLRRYRDQQVPGRAPLLGAQAPVAGNTKRRALFDPGRISFEELLRAQENQRLAELEARRAAEVLGLRTIRSPFNGVVVEVLLKPGEFGAISFKDPIMKLAEIDPLHVEAILPASMYGRVKRGQRAVVMPEPPIGGTYETRVSVVDRVIDAASGTLGVRLELPNGEGAVPAGVRCRVRFR